MDPWNTFINRTRPSQIPAGRRNQLQCEAFDDAYKMMYRDIYRNKMRYEPYEVKDELDLTDEDVEMFSKAYHSETESQMPLRYVVVNFPDTPEEYYEKVDQFMKQAKKASKKTYIGKCLVTLELGKDETHVHYNILFEKNNKWLCKSKIISDFYSTFKSVSPELQKDQIFVKSLGDYAWNNTEKYCKKENLWSYQNYQTKVKKQ